jgi:hypothetical protein
MKKTISVLLAFGMAVAAQAQQKVYDSVTVSLFKEMEAVQAMYGGGNRLSFTATYYMEDVHVDVEVGNTVVRDTSVGQYKMFGNKLYMTMDSLEAVQNDKVFATLYHDNRTAVLQKPAAAHQQVLQVDVNSPVFQQLAMKAMAVADSGSFRKLTMQFDSLSLYTHYEVVYDTASRLVTHVNYSMRKMLDPQVEDRVHMRIVFSNYQVNVFDETVFDHSRFFTLYGPKDIRLKQTYEDYEVVNLMEEDEQ